MQIQESSVTNLENSQDVTLSTHDHNPVTATVVQTLCSYVPAHLVDRCLAHAEIPQTPLLEKFPAAVLFADISGFTALTERLAERGASGVEELTKHLNAYFGQLIALISDRGGDIVKFAGDAMLALWIAPDGDLATQTARAAQCSLDILQNLRTYIADDIYLTLHLGIAAGEMMGLHVGGSGDRWEFLVAGEPLAQMASAEVAAQKGEVCISPQGWALIRDRFIGTTVESGNIRLDGAIAEQIPTPNRTCNLVSLTSPDELAASVSCYVDASVKARLAASQTEWLGELRQVTVIFLNLPGLDYNRPDALAKVHEFVGLIQTLLARYEGTVNKFLVDDKGSTLIAVFGLPLFSHEDDAERGVLAAIEIREQLRAWGWHPKIGITTGRAYCGTVGSEVRREFTAIADVVNLSARLMQAANDEILCDLTTKSLASGRGRVRFQSLPKIQVKGKKAPVKIYRPLEVIGTERPGWEFNKSPGNLMVGRQKLRQSLADKLEQLRQGKNGVAIISGEPGIGKSRAISDLLDRAEAEQITYLIAAGEPVEKSTSYYAWRSVFSQLLDLNFITEREARRQQVRDLLCDDPELWELAPLLNAVVSLELPETDVTKELSPDVRSAKTRDLLVRLVQDSARRSPKLLIIEDAHWLDSASWALTLQVSEQVTPLLMAIASRPMGDDSPPEYAQLLGNPYTEHFPLNALPTEEAIALACLRLGVAHLPDAVAQFIGSQAEGNPFFTEELAYALRDSGLILIDDGTCTLAPGVEDLHALNLPNTIEGIVTTRIDRLSAAQELTLKVASVIGRVFAESVVQDIHPIAEDKDQIALYLDALDRLDMTPREQSELERSYIFKHIITQEVAYNLMLFAQRRQLHEAVAHWYERVYSHDLGPFYPTLAHHWSKAEVAEKAIAYLEKAGEQALYNYANQEAALFYRQAIEWLQTLPETPEELARELNLQVALASALVIIKGYASPEVKPVYDRARYLCQRVGDTPQLFSVLHGLAGLYIMGGDFYSLLKVCDRQQQLAEKFQQPEMILETNLAYGDAYLSLGQLSRARTYFEISMSLYNREQFGYLAFLYGHDPGVAALSLNAWTMWLLGYPDTALELIQEDVTHARILAHPHSLAYALAFAATVHQFRGEIPQLCEFASETLEICQEHGFPLWMPMARIVLGWVDAVQDNSEQAIGEMYRALEDYQALGFLLWLPYYRTLVAEGLFRARQWRECQQVLESARSLVLKTEEGWYESEVMRIAGELLWQGEREASTEAIAFPEGYFPQTPEACFEEALNMARSHQAKSLELRAALSLARLWQEQGKITEADQLLSEIYGWFKEGFETADLKAAERVLASLKSS
ncbi:AAA family ATPase [Oscillatoria sp. HE19RPO]|uniref:AAA family ATPase n=1 Tax=Oscillatoria sp. HE19RPO TaxID=2954806 RepID=UPI0020C31C26|nr:adenylate/guanylate cyclase domain-containing protein [Oscillatoria sp. HE19RPO]